MNVRRHNVYVCLSLATCALAVAAAPLAARGQAPQLTTLFPAGVQRGETAAVTAGGSFPRWPVKFWTDRAGLQVEAAEEKGKLNFTAAADAGGLYLVRAYDEQGASPLRPFVVGSLAELVEQEPNDAPDQAQQVTEAAMVVNGRLQRGGDVDGYAVTLQKGQQLVAALDAHRQLASPMDGVLQVCTADGFVLAQNDDERGVDPLIVYQVPADSIYVVRVFAFPETPTGSISLAGGDTFVYRLTLTAGPFIDYALPMAVEQDKAATVQLGGWNLGSATAELPAPDAGADVVRAVGDNGASLIQLPVLERPTLVASSSSSVESPDELPVPASITGVLGAEGDDDAFALKLTKGQKIELRVEAYELGYALDAVLSIADEAGKVLSESDDAGKQRDPVIAFTAPADGRFVARVRDLHGRGGQRFVYRLDATLAEPDFTLSLATDTFEVARGQSVEVPVTIERRNGMAEELEIRVEGLPAGVTAEPAKSAAEGDTAKSVKLQLTADGAAAAASAPIRIVGKSLGPSGLERTATFAAPAGAQAADAWLTVK